MNFKKAQSVFATKEQRKKQDILYWSEFFWLACKYAFKQGQKGEVLSNRELCELSSLYGNIKPFVWFNKKGSSSFLVEVSKEQAEKLFPSYVIFYKEKGILKKRCWWNKVNGRYHQFPEAESYYCKKGVLL